MDYVLRSFALIEHVLRDRLAFFGEIARGEGVEQKIRHLTVIVVCGLAIFGLVMGAGTSLTLALLNALKLPCVFLIGGLICLPTLYYFSLLFGSQLRFSHIVTLILTAQAVTTVLLLGFAPISILFWLSAAGDRFLLFLNMGALALTLVLGLIFLVQGALYLQEHAPPERVSLFAWARMLVLGHVRSFVLLTWLVVYGMVILQLGWTMRPFFGVPIEGRNVWEGLIQLIFTR